jgi:hypothetical protein
MRVPTEAPSHQATASAQLPAWVAALEIVCLLALFVELVILVSGGFRLRLAGSRISVTSPLRPLIWAVAAGGIRQLAARSTPLVLPRLVERWSRPDGVRAAFAAMIGTRPAILFVGYLAVIMFGYAGGAPPYRVSASEAVNLSVRWDTGWYLGIVTDGYSVEARNPEGQQSIVFFPAYPLIVRAVGDLLGGQLGSDILAGVVVSFAAFFCALVYLYALARETLDEAASRDVLWLVAAYPFAVFFGAIYTESLFLLGATAAFYHFKRQQFGRAAIWGLIVGLTRPPGCLLSIPLAVLALEPWLPWPATAREGVKTAGGSQDDRRPPPKSLLPALVTAAMPGVGMLMYSAFIWRIAGNPLAWASGHAAWGRTYQGLGVLVIDHYHYIANAGLEGYVRTLPHDLLNGLGALFVLAAAWPVARRLSLAYAVFILVNILPPLAAGGLLSAGRFSSVLFPAFIWLAGDVPHQHRAGWIATFAALQALVAALFYTWRNVY